MLYLKTNKTSSQRSRLFSWKLFQDVVSVCCCVQKIWNVIWMLGLQWRPKVCDFGIIHSFKSKFLSGEFYPKERALGNTFTDLVKLQRTSSNYWQTLTPFVAKNKTKGSILYKCLAWNLYQGTLFFCYHNEELTLTMKPDLKVAVSNKTCASSFAVLSSLFSSTFLSISLISGWRGLISRVFFWLA